MRTGNGTPPLKWWAAGWLRMVTTREISVNDCEKHASCGTFGLNNSQVFVSITVGPSNCGSPRSWHDCCMDVQCIFSAKQFDVLRRFVGRCLRVLLNVEIEKMKGVQTMTDVRKRAKVEDVSVQIHRRALRWLGRVIRKGPFDQHGRPYLEYMTL